MIQVNNKDNQRPGQTVFKEDLQIGKPQWKNVSLYGH